MCKSGRLIPVKHNRDIAARIRYVEAMQRHVDAKLADDGIRGKAASVAACEACRETLADDRRRLKEIEAAGHNGHPHVAVCADAAIEDAHAAFDRLLRVIVSAEG